MHAPAPPLPVPVEDRGPLVVRLCNWIGDVVMSLPALELLHAHGYRLHLVGKGWAPTLLSGYPWPVLKRASGWADRVAQLRSLRRHVQGQAPRSARPAVDALVMPNSFSSALELRLAGWRTLGYAHEGRGPLLARRLKLDPQAHELRALWTLASALAGVDAPTPSRIDLKLSPAARERAQALVAARGWERGYVCIAPFAASAVQPNPKVWPAFPAFTRALAADRLTVVVCPGPSEVQEAREAYPQAQVVEDLPLDDYAALLAGARLMVANDTGPGHLAAAVGTPLLSVFGPSVAAKCHPWGPNVTLMSRFPAFPTLDEVLAAARARLG